MKITNNNYIIATVESFKNTVYKLTIKNNVYYLMFEMPDSCFRIVLFERERNNDGNIVLTNKDLEQFNIVTKEIYCSKSGKTLKYLIVYPNLINIEYRTTLFYKGESITLLDKTKEGYLIYVRKRGAEEYSIKQLNIIQYYNLYHFLCENNNYDIIKVDNNYDIICYKDMHFIVEKNNILNFKRAYRAININENMLLCAGIIWVKE